MKVFINPGHSPNGIPDCGAVNRELGLRECDVAYDISGLIKKYLENAYCEVIMLQSDNLNNDGVGENVCQLANSEKCDVFVSVHCNAHNGSARGAETLVMKQNSKAGILADCIQSQLVPSLKKIDKAFADRGVKERPNLVVLNSTTMPAALVEVGFIDNYADACLMTMYNHVIAAAIARGITDYAKKFSNS